MARSFGFWAWIGSLLAVVLFLGAWHRIDIMLAVGTGLGFTASILKTWSNRHRMFDADTLADMLRHWGVTVALIAVVCREFDGLIPRMVAMLVTLS